MKYSKNEKLRNYGYKGPTTFSFDSLRKVGEAVDIIPSRNYVPEAEDMDAEINEQDLDDILLEEAVEEESPEHITLGPPTSENLAFFDYLFRTTKARINAMEGLPPSEKIV